MKVLFVRPLVEMGGASRHMLSLAAGLAERGHAVTLGASGGEWLPRFTSTFKLPLYPSLPHNLILSAALMTRLVRQEGMEIIHSHHRFSTLVGRIVSGLTAVPLVCTVHEFRFNWRWLAPLWLAPLVCVPSASLGQDLIRRHRISPDCMTVVRPGVAPLTSGPEPARPPPAAGRSRSERPVIGFVGRLASEKGTAVLVQALPSVFNKHAEGRAWIVGDGSERAALEKLSRALGVAERVCFMGERLDAPQLMLEMDVIAVPSLTESFGLTAAEAMAAGRPVVASAVGGLPELIDDGVTGYLVPPGDVEALAQRISDVLADSRRAAAMGEAGRRKSAAWTPARAAEITEAVYRRAMTNH